MNDQKKTNPDDFFTIDPASNPDPTAEADAEFFRETRDEQQPEAAAESAPPLPKEKKTDGQPAPDWERPESVTHDHHHKAWLLFIGIILLSVAFFRPVKIFVQRQFYRAPVVSTERNSTEFVALAYYGVEANPGPGSSSVSTAMFKEQMRMLDEAGYNPITLKDVRDFYKQGRLLPQKAVLLTFEQARRGTYNQVREILQSAKWPAVMGVNTLSVRSMNQETLIWHYLRNMHDLGFWELAAESHRGFTEIETAPNDAQATFFTSPMWLPNENRYELPAEFEQRIAADHRFVVDEFKREIQDAPIAFFFPFGNYGQYDERAKIVRAVNLRQVREHYDLAFILGMLALNTRDSDPRRLNRLLVDPSWSPNAFISMVDSFWPRPWPDDPQASLLYEAGAWLGDWGEVFTRGKTLIMQAIPTLDEIKDLQTGTSSGTTGAKAWLVGSDTFRDGQVSMLVNIRRGRFGIHLRGGTLGEYIFISIDERGNVSARQKLQDVDELILASDVIDTDVAVSHNLTVHLRDNLLFVLLDGNVLFDGRIPLRGEPGPGLIGASIWDPIVGVAATEIISTRISGRRDAVVTWSVETGRNTAHLNTWLTDNAFRFSVIAPPWIEIVASGSTVTTPWDATAISLIARANHAMITPTMKLQDVDALVKIAESSIASKAREHGADGIFIDAQACDPSDIPTLLGWLTRLNDVLRQTDRKLLLRLPEGFGRTSSSINVVSLLPDVVLIGDDLESYNLPPERAMSAVSVPPSAFNETLNYYYQVSNVLTENDDISDEARNEELRQEGFDAFAAGAYDEAIEAWTRWAKRDPDNAEPLALTGDALLRKEKKDEAVRHYAASLKINPGQIDLAIRYASLLYDIGETETATQLMDVYARTFPDNPKICIAQARWLDRARRRGDARALMRQLVESQPKNIEARLVLQNYLDDPAERYENMHQLRQLVESAETYHYGFAQELVSSELLTIPEATIFFPFIQSVAKNGPNLRTQKAYEQLLPLTNTITENFTRNPLSDAWIPWDGMRSSTGGKYQLRATPAVAEAYLRLKKSELMRDGAISVTLDESVGAFWIYARRSSRSMLRFGYDNDGYIRMQTWFDGQLKSTERQPWLRPPGIVTLKLEVRGDGAMGFENGTPLFSTRIRIPKEISYGWWSIAPYSPNLGSAKASILKIQVDPLPSGLALIPMLETPKIPDALEHLRKNVQDVSIVAPVAIRQHPNGSLPPTPDIDLGPYKMFCAFHRIRLVPVVEAPYYSKIKPALLVDIINKQKFEGMILRVTSMPPEAWFEEMRTELENTSGSLIVLQSTEPLWPNRPGTGQTGAQSEYLRLKALDPIRVREIQLGNLILTPIQDTWTLRASPLQDWMQTPPAERRAGIEPRVIILPVTETIADSDFEAVREKAAPDDKTDSDKPDEPKSDPPTPAGTRAGDPPPQPAAAENPAPAEALITDKTIYTHAAAANPDAPTVGTTPNTNSPPLWKLLESQSN